MNALECSKIRLGFRALRLLLLIVALFTPILDVHSDAFGVPVKGNVKVFETCADALGVSICDTQTFNQIFIPFSVCSGLFSVYIAYYIAQWCQTKEWTWLDQSPNSSVMTKAVEVGYESGFTLALIVAVVLTLTRYFPDEETLGAGFRCLCASLALSFVSLGLCIHIFYQSDGSTTQHRMDSGAVHRNHAVLLF